MTNATSRKAANELLMNTLFQNGGLWLDLRELRSAGIKTSCSIITRRESGDLICWFSENIAESQHSFVVHRYNVDHTETTPVVHCTWIAQGLACTSESGYVFNKEVSAIALIEIPHLTKHVEGKYVCQVVGNDNTDDEVCEYQYTDETVACHSSECTGLIPWTLLGVTLFLAIVAMIIWLRQRPIIKEVISRFSQTADEDLKEIASRFEKRLFQLFDIIDLSVEAALRRHRRKTEEEVSKLKV
ncbi:hypothetical protein BaRGS_00040243 [Batillaria attramentaria]|uniref:Ig-like domain-containing protein n=1 Tax=Batillaria attramentaria TaxID=370345 RepID=A0ABD0J1F8_9CAEN